MQSKEIAVLLVDDDDVDIEAVARALGKHQIECQLSVACEGQEALAILRHKFSLDASQDWIVLLDLNMPGMNGMQFLEELRADANLKSTKVLVYTTSQRERDRIDASRFDVVGYYLKSELDSLLDAIEQYSNGVEFMIPQA